MVRTRRGLDRGSTWIERDVDHEPLTGEGVVPEHRVADAGFADERLGIETEHPGARHSQHADERLARVVIEVANEVIGWECHDG